MAAVTVAGYYEAEARRLTSNLLAADVTKVSASRERLGFYRCAHRPPAGAVLEQDRGQPPDPDRRLRALIGLVERHPRYAAELQEAMLDDRWDYQYLEVIGDALEAGHVEFLEEVWPVFGDPRRSAEKRFRAGLVLARYDPDSANWTEEGQGFLVEQLVSANLIYHPKLLPLLSNVSDRLLKPLEAVFRSADRPETQRIAAANAIAFLSSGDATLLATLLAEATPSQYGVLYAAFERATDRGSPDALMSLVKQQPPEELGTEQRIALGRRRAGAAITLLRQGEREAIFDALRVRDDPESLAQFVHRCRDRGVTGQQLLECLRIADGLRQKISGKQREIENRVVFGLLLALGEFPKDELPRQEQKRLVADLADWYRNDPSSAIHGATGWLLRKWGQHEIASKVDHTPVPYSPDREWYTLEIETNVNGAGLHTFYMTFVVIPEGNYEIGSPSDELERFSYETRHEVHITRAYALLDREVNWAEFASFDERLATQWQKY